MNKLININEDLIVNGKGFLPAEDRIGVFSYQDENYNYVIQEIISSRGIKIIYSITSENNLCNIIEDYSTNDFILTYLTLPTENQFSLEDFEKLFKTYVRQYSK